MSCEQQWAGSPGLSVRFEAVKPHAYHTTILSSQKFLSGSCEKHCFFLVQIAEIQRHYFI